MVKANENIWVQAVYMVTVTEKVYCTFKVTDVDTLNEDAMVEAAMKSAEENKTSALTDGTNRIVDIKTSAPIVKTIFLCNSDGDIDSDTALIVNI